MDEIRKVAKAYYKGAAGSEKELARQLFRSLDSNGDGKVSLHEYKKMVKPSFSSNDLFKQLDANCDGTLDFDEVLALNYMDKVSVPRCNACNSLLLDSYFSCLPCQADVSYYLCCNCYAGGEVKHHHSSNKFVDTRAMLKLLDQLLKQAQITTHQILDQGLEGVEKLADVVTQGLAHEEEDDDDEEEDGDEEDEEDEDDNGEEDEDEEEGGDGDGDDEEVVDGVNECADRNLMNYGKAVYKSQPESKKSNGSHKKTKKNGKAGKPSKLRGRSKREKVAGTIKAMNNTVHSFSEKKKKVKAVISVGSAVVKVGAKAVASTLFHHVVR